MCLTQDFLPSTRPLGAMETGWTEVQYAGPSQPDRILSDSLFLPGLRKERGEISLEPVMKFAPR